MTQEQLILEHLKYKGAITPLSALNKYGCFRLASVVFNLKKKGNNIVTIMKESGGKNFASYSLIFEHNGFKNPLQRHKKNEPLRDLFTRNPAELMP